MARIRSIKPEFWQDEKLAPLPPIHRLVFLGLIGMADDAGRLLDNVKIIDAFIFPSTSDSAAESLAVLHGLGRIRRGVTASGQSVIELVNWRHQKIDKPNLASALPTIAEESPTPPRTVADASATNHRTISVICDLDLDQDHSSPEDASATPRDGLPVAGATAAAAASANGSLRGGWPADAARLWGEHIGILPPARLGKALAPAVKLHGWDTPIGPGPPVRVVFEQYCLWRPYKRKDGYANAKTEPKDVQFCSPEEFVRTYAQWLDLLTPIGDG